MAHAGTPTDLAKQPATSTTNGLWQALLAAVVLFALVAGMVFVGTNLASKGSALAAADHRYDQIEARRGGAVLAANASRIEAQRGPTTAAAAQIYVADGSYDQVEKSRGGAFAAPTKISGTAPDNGPGRIQGHRGAMIDQ